MTEQVRTRFAPSPTGFQHIGGIRTAFYAWLLAKHHGGSFVLRIEDTDQERRVPGAIKFILQELAWFGVFPDEGPSAEELEKVGENFEGVCAPGGEYGPYIQSLRLPRYREIAERLIEGGFAYRCDCTPEMLEKERAEQMARKEVPGYSGYCRTRNVSPDVPHVIRFKMPYKPKVSMTDAVKGLVTWESIPLKDPVLMKTDKFPLYHLAVVVDDHDMEISHVMRGDEWLPSTPLHLLIYEALGWKAPIFATLPVVLGTDGKKLSKRSGAASSFDLRQEGYIAEAILNYMVLVGWSPGEGEEREIFSREELTKRFTLSGINRASGVFDVNKLSWMNGAYLRAMPAEEFSKKALEFLEQEDFFEKSSPEHMRKWETIAPHVQERVKTLKEVPPMVEFLFIEDLNRDVSAMLGKAMDREKAREVLSDVRSAFESLKGFSTEALEAALGEAAGKHGLKTGPVFLAVRIAVTGKKATPPLFDSIIAVGKEKTLSRLEETVALL